MSLAAYFAVHLLAGWLAGKAYASLMRARARGKFAPLDWGIFVASMAVAMLFARFVIGGAKRMPDIPDLAVGLSAIVMLAVFVWTSGMLRGDSRR
jgi:uncharacterized membrane protein (UPF0136 family)